MVHAIPEGIIRVNEGDAILSLPLKRVVKNKPMVSYIFIQAKNTFRNRWSFRKHILRILNMFAVGDEEESPLTMFTPVLPFIRNQIIYSRFHIGEVTLQMGTPF